MYMDPFYSPGREKIHALGGIDMALWDIKAKALNVPLYMLCGGKVREHVQLYATSGLPRERPSQARASRSRAEAMMASGYYVYRVDGSIQPNPGFDGVLRGGGAGGGRGAGAGPAPAQVAVAARDRAADLRLARADHGRSRRPPNRYARESVKRGTGRSTSTRSSTFTRPSNLPPDRAVPPVLRRRPGEGRAVPDADSETAAADERASRTWRRVGPALGVQHARREPRHRLRARDTAQCRRRDGNAQDHGDVRHAQGRHRAALHRSGRHCRAHSHDDGVPRAGRHGIQLRRDAAPAHLRSSSISATASAGRTIGRVLESRSIWRSSRRWRNTRRRYEGTHTAGATARRRIGRPRQKKRRARR